MQKGLLRIFPSRPVSDGNPKKPSPDPPQESGVRVSKPATFKVTNSGKQTQTLSNRIRVSSPLRFSLQPLAG